MKTAVLICPGRGTYTKTELGSLARFPDPALLARFDAERARLGQETLTALDGAQAYSVARHIEVLIALLAEARFLRGGTVA